MALKTFNKLDIYNAIYNKQEQLIGAGTVADDTKTFFIIAISGSSITIKDKNANNVFVSTASLSFNIPLRIDDSFTVTGTSPIVTFARL